MVSRLGDRLIGSIVAGALGDALGGAYEGRVAPVSMNSEKPLELSDDTQMTLATCEAIGAMGHVTPEAVADRFLHWYRERRFTGVGASTLKALRDLEVGAHWALAGRTGEMAAGNGAAMRAAPLAFVLDLDSRADKALLRDICWITHQSDEAYSGALAVIASIQAMVSGTWKPGACLVSLAAQSLPDTNTRDVLFAMADIPAETPILEVAAKHGCSGYVAESVPLAIYASQQIEGLGLEGVLSGVIEAGGDTDTIASMKGQIAGSLLGITGVPHQQLARIPEVELILRTAWSLSARLGFPGEPADDPNCQVKQG